MERGGKGRVGEKNQERSYLLSGLWMDTFLFSCDSMTHSNTLSIFSAFFSSFSHSLTPQPTLLLFWDPPLIFQKKLMFLPCTMAVYAAILWLAMLLHTFI